VQSPLQYPDRSPPPDRSRNRSLSVVEGSVVEGSVVETTPDCSRNSLVRRLSVVEGSVVEGLLLPERSRRQDKE